MGHLKVKSIFYFWLKGPVERYFEFYTMKSRIIKSIINTYPSRTIGGTMDSENLLANIATVFDTSNHNSSQDLLKKIINLAAQKLNCSNNSKDHQGQK